MQKILISVPTINEILPLINSIPELNKIDENIYVTKKIKILITGIGITATIYNLTKLLSEEKFDFIFNVGIAGSADKNLKIGDVLEVKEEEFADFGVTKNGFIDANKYGFVQENIFNDNKLINKSLYDSGLNKVVGRTVNTIDYDGNNLCSNKYFQIESMEGAAFFYVCLKENINFAEIRSISNYVGDGNKENWNIKLAISNLNNEIIRLLKL